MLNQKIRYWNIIEKRFNFIQFDTDTFQYTGYKDKHGVEIYEGNIIDIDWKWNGKDIKLKCIIQFGVEEERINNFKYIGFYLEDSLGQILSGAFDELIKNNFSFCEVVGNIYENLEK